MNKNPLRILLAGVPFGRDNIGDEAILECIVNILREINPEAEITVSTDTPEYTSKHLMVKTCPLYGFEDPGYSKSQLDATLAEIDLVIWAGATGLSDYPEVPLRIIKRAQDLGCKTALFCVGMNEDFNPKLYKLQPGKRKLLYTLLRVLTFNRWNLVQNHEARKQKRTESLIKQVIPHMDFISVRDLPTQKRLKKILKNGARIRVGADPALSLGLNPLGREKTRKVLKHRFSNDYKKIGICISAQAPLANLEKLVHLMERISNKKKVVWIGLPMNPKTDTVVLNRIKAELNRPGDLIIMNDLIEPGQVASAAELCDIVVSSRLHLLILSAISRTPFIGISRGSKVDNFAHAFSMPLTGSVEHPDYAQLESLLLTPAREHPISKTDYRKKLSNMNLSLDYVIRALQQFLKSIRA